VSGRRGLRGWVLVLAFVVVPLIEIAAIIQVGEVIGAWWTIVLLVVDSLVGAWLVRREGRTAWRALTTALSSGTMPARELADGALVLIGGTLMLTPGFVTDAVGFLLILPFTRPVARGLLTRVVTRRLVVIGPTGGATGGWPGAYGPDARRPGPGQGPVVRGEVVDDD
jgi:UPF0716 protein FxsA